MAENKQQFHTKNTKKPAGSAGNIALTANMSDQLASLVGLDLFVTSLGTKRGSPLRGCSNRKK